MNPHLRLGRIADIEIGIHYSWIVIATVITLSLGAHFAEVNPQWATGVLWTAAVVTGLLFFASIVIHELGHALVARARGLPVRSITLFALGGVASIEKDAADARTEFWMGIAGPLTSVGIGAVCIGVAWALGWGMNLTPVDPPMAVLVWLGYINIMLAAFNMIPGFPMDGGRVLRAALWAATGNADRATRIAARIGEGVALLFIMFGVWQFFSGAGVGSLWMALIGWFLLDAAGAAYMQVDAVATLKGLRVRDIMADDCLRVEARTPLRTFADDYLLRTGRRCFVVEKDGQIEGLITAADLKHVDRDRWAYVTVGGVMRPLNRLRTVTPETPVVEALQAMGQEDLNQLPVVSNGRVEGMLSRGRVIQVLQTRAELSM
ncbi:MAG TPA: site-2 protease family protein [Nitrospiraceae bacterium]|nr:site-2 protease family protein [Nitrospiraceae bacterium]